jgi:hypothetical protein
LARIWHGYLIFAALRLLAAAGHTGCSRILAGHRGALMLAPGRFLCQCRLHRRCSAPLPRAAGPGSRTGPDLRFWWQVQDSNLGRLSPTILQTVPGTALTWANTRQSHDLGTHLTWWHGTNRTHSPPGSSFTDHAQARTGGLACRQVPGAFTCAAGCPDPAATSGQQAIDRAVGARPGGPSCSAARAEEWTGMPPPGACADWLKCRLPDHQAASAHAAARPSPLPRSTPERTCVMSRSPSGIADPRTTMRYDNSRELHQMGEPNTSFRLLAA